MINGMIQRYIHMKTQRCFLYLFTVKMSTLSVFDCELRVCVCICLPCGFKGIHSLRASPYLTPPYPAICLSPLPLDPCLTSSMRLYNPRKSINQTFSHIEKNHHQTTPTLKDPLRFAPTNCPVAHCRLQLYCSALSIERVELSIK